MFKRIVHPGAVLGDEIEHMGISIAELARQISVPANRLSQVVAGKRSISGDTALRLGHWFGMEPQFWMNLQSQYDLAIAQKKIGEVVETLPKRVA